MSRSNKDRYEKPFKPVKKHVKMVVCDNCGERYPEDEVSVEIDAATKQIVGRYCSNCL